MLLWKLLITGALSGLVLGSILMMVVVYRLAPLLQSRRQRSRRDQHQRPIPRFGGVGMAWAFFGAVGLLVWLPFEERGLGLEMLPQSRLWGLLFGALLAWMIGFADNVWTLRARWDELYL